MAPGKGRFIGAALDLFPFKRNHLQVCMTRPFRGRSSAAPA